MVIDKQQLRVIAAQSFVGVSAVFTLLQEEDIGSPWKMSEQEMQTLLGEIREAQLGGM